MPVAVIVGRRIRIRGIVQGVGFRPWVYRQAHRAGVTGRVHNDASGVTIDAFGDAERLDEFVATLQVDLPPAASVAELSSAPIPPEQLETFKIVESETAADRQVSIPPDLATCDRCAAEIADPADRRYRYAFTNCTDCGPRFTIVTDVPYDRATTTMAPFVMCPACRREYEDPANRRFHAEPNACPVCGPKVTLHAHTGDLIGVDDAIAAAAEGLRLGLIVAVKGLGGFHLACDATDADAVDRLRARKHRDEKPLAVMVADLGAAMAIAQVGAEERRLLTSVERPIVVMRKRPGTPIAGNVAPRNRMIGVFLPYTPLHHLLLADTGRPLVMTSGNLSEEPIAVRNDEAVARLSGLADLFLMHDREIATRADDSVASVVAGRGVVLRRSRGYVPRPMRVDRGFARPILACGAQLKNAFCLASGDRAWLGPHIGDLDNLETYDAYVDAIARLERFLDVRPAVIAHDLHPDYLSTRYASQRPEAVKIPVQHHHAHVVSAMAEHQIDGPVIGLAYDGTGYGTDGTMWGGELLVAEAAGYTRVATFRPIPLIGGDRAIRQPWRIALALVTDAFDGDVPPSVWSLFDEVSNGEAPVVRELLRGRVNAPLARGVGRYFDAFGALFLERRQSAFEGQIALEWNQVADPTVRRSYHFDIRTLDEPWEIDLRSAVREAVDEARAGAPPSEIAAAFHNTLAEVTAAAVRLAAGRHGALPVVASGGCFQNARLAASVRAALVPEFDVRLHATVPPGDGGIALGQAAIADAILRGQSCV